MLLAESFVLLALDPDGAPARGATTQSAAEVGVTGALLTELVQQGHLTLDDRGRIGLTGTRPDHPLLAQVLDNVAKHDGKKLTSRLGAIKHSGWNEVVEGLIAQGVVGREKRALRPTRHPVADVGAHAHLLAEVRAAATGTGPLEPRVAALLALAGPCQLLEVVAPERGDRTQAKARIAEATEQVPAAKAVKHVIDAAAMAVATGATVAATSAATSS